MLTDRCTTALFTCLSFSTVFTNRRPAALFTLVSLATVFTNRSTAALFTQGSLATVLTDRNTAALFTRVSSAPVFANRCTNFHAEFPSYAFTILGTTLVRFFVMRALGPKLLLPVVNLIKPRICVEYDPTEWRKFTADTARHHMLLECYMFLSFKYKFRV